MGNLPATFHKNPRYVSSYSEARSLMVSRWSSGININSSSFVALYHCSEQTDWIIFTDEAVIVGQGDSFNALNLKDIETSRHKKVGCENTKDVEYKKMPDGISITMYSGEQHIVDVMGASGRVRDAYSMSRLIATLKRRQENI